VGIGTATPGAKLSINGGLHVGGDSNPGDNNLLVDGTTTTSELSVSENLYFATGSRQKINLHEESYGIGIQSATQYFRSLNNFAWYKGGEHNDNELNPGSGTVQMVIKDGNVGIGKAPEDGHKLEIYGGDLVFKVDDPYNNKDQGILFQNAGSYYTWRIYRANAGSDYADLKIDSGKHTSSTDLTNRMTITNDGKVGIGTASPEAKLSINGGLHVGGNSDPGDNNLLVDGTTTTNELSVSGSLSFSDGTRLKINLHDERYGIGIQTDTQYFRTHNNFAWYKGGTHSNNALNPGDDGTVQMVIKNGNVGIGTATPGAKLSVNGGLHVGGNSDPGDNNLEVDGTTTTNELSVSGNLDFATGSRQKINLHQESYGIGIQSETQYFRSLKNFAWYKGGVPDEGRLNPGNGGTVQMVIEDNGNVGIGTDDPGAKLDVDGNLKLQNGVAVNEISDSGTLSSSSQKILTEQAIKSYVDQRLPSGVILMWSGAANQIPQGWVLCDGQNNTPNLKDRFIVGAGNSYNPGNTGGYNQVTLTIEQMPSHNHANGNYKYLMRKNINWTTDGTDKNGANEPDVVNVGEIKSQGSNQAHENRPPYYALCFIMKS
nr:hypothetical protein [Trichodesmium sp. MO_231.B1]